jgi:hypothetical protein
MGSHFLGIWLLVFSLSVAGLPRSFSLGLNLGLLILLVVLGIVDVSPTLALGDSARAALELTLNIQEVYHRFRLNATTAFKINFVSQLLQCLVVH